MGHHKEIGNHQEKAENKSSHEPRHVVLCPSFRVQKNLYNRSPKTSPCELHSHGPICSKLHRTPGCAGCIGGFAEVSWVNGGHHLGWIRRVKPATKWPVSMWLLYHIWLIWPMYHVFRCRSWTKEQVKTVWLSPCQPSTIIQNGRSSHLQRWQSQQMRKQGRRSVGDVPGPRYNMGCNRPAKGNLQWMRMGQK